MCRQAPPGWSTGEGFRGPLTLQKPQTHQGCGFCIWPHATLSKLLPSGLLGPIPTFPCVAERAGFAHACQADAWDLPSHPMWDPHPHPSSRVPQFPQVLATAGLGSLYPSPMATITSTIATTALRQDSYFPVVLKVSRAKQVLLLEVTEWAWRLSPRPQGSLSPQPLPATGLSLFGARLPPVASGVFLTVHQVDSDTSPLFHLYEPSGVSSSPRARRMPSPGQLVTPILPHAALIFFGHVDS